MDTLYILVSFLIACINAEQSELARERLKILVPSKTESCFFIANLKEANVLSVRFLVITYKNGKPQDITFRMKDPNTYRMINYQARKNSGNLSNYEVTEPGELEVCFNNRHSLMDAKTVVWEYDVSGEDSIDISEYQSNATLTEYLEMAESVRRSVIKVRGKVARSKHTQWWLNQKVRS